MSQACTSCIQNENVAESPVFEKMPYPNFDRVFSQLFPQKTCFSYVVHGAILTSWPHGLAKVISDCPALQIAPGFPLWLSDFRDWTIPPYQCDATNWCLPVCDEQIWKVVVFVLFFVLKNYCTILRLS